MANELQTYGDIKQVIASVIQKQKVAKLKSTGGDFVLGAALSVLPGGEAIKTGIDFIKAGFSRPDTKKTNTWIDKLDVDDEVSKILDDTVENQFIQYIANRILKEPDDKQLENDFNMNALLVDFIKDNFEGRTVTGIKEAKIPKWIADIFKTKKEKRSEQDQLDLDKYVADLQFSDPDKYERLQSILKHVDPDTGHLPTGLNTGNIDESTFDDIKASPNKFTNWEYKDPKDPSIGKRIISKGRNATEAPERGQTPYFMREIKTKLKNIVKELMADMPPTDPPVVPLHKATEVPAEAALDQMMAQVNDMTLDQLYTLGKQISANFPGFNPSFKGLSPEETEEKLRLEIKRFMNKNKSIVLKVFNFDGNTITLKAMQLKENKNKTKMNKKHLMEMIREVIAEEVGKVGIVLDREGVIASITPEQQKELENMKSATKAELEKFGITHDEMDDEIRYKIRSIGNSVHLVPILNYIPDNPYSHKKVTENKMKVNQLRQIIREEIENVMMQQAMPEYTVVSWRGPFGDSYPEQMDPATAMALSALGTTDLKGRRVPAAVWEKALQDVALKGKLGDWLMSNMGKDLNITIDPKAEKVTLKNEEDLAKTRDAITSREKADIAASLARMGLR